MATVEELRFTCIALISDSPAILGKEVARGILDTLITAAEKRGEETYKAFIENNDTRRAAIATLDKQSQMAYETGKREGLEQGRAAGAEQMKAELAKEDEDDSVERVAMAIAYEKGKAKGAEQERERIRETGSPHDKGSGFPYYTIMASVLAPEVKP